MKCFPRGLDLRGFFRVQSLGVWGIGPRNPAFQGRLLQQLGLWVSGSFWLEFAVFHIGMWHNDRRAIAVCPTLTVPS